MSELLKDMDRLEQNLTVLLDEQRALMERHRLALQLLDRAWVAMEASDVWDERLMAQIEELLRIEGVRK